MTISNHGHLVVVVGPSGAGKDSLLNAANKQFNDHPRIQFVQRVITRPCDPASEVHDSVSEAQFKEQERAGAFSVWWQANGLYYGLPASVHTGLEHGQLLIANGSRAALPAIREAFKALTIVHVCASNSALAERLANRSRESTEQIEQRLQRNLNMQPIIGKDVITIDNSGDREIAIKHFISLLEKCLV